MKKWFASFAVLLLLAGCSSADGGNKKDGLKKVSVVLDWTPNTNHTGLYVAQEKGFYEEEGINLKILPYSNAAADTIVGAGKANCGISFQENVPLAVAAGTKEIAVMT